MITAPRWGVAPLRAVAASAVLLLSSASAAAQQNSLRVQWGSNATEYRGQNGRWITVICPPGGQTGDVYGTDVYTDDSLICPAAVHAGLISFASGGPVTLMIAPGDSMYRASVRNGVTSRAFRSWHGSFRFGNGTEAGQIEWKTTALGLSPAITRPLALKCPPQGTLGTVWGTDIYTDDSSICAAAVHAGVIRADSGGTLSLMPAGAVQSYTASTRNGVTSRDYGARPNGFTVTRGGVATAASSSTAPAVTSSVVAPVATRTTATTATAITSATTATTATTATSATTARAPAVATQPAITAIQPTAVPTTLPPARATAETRAIATASSRQPADPPAVHATGFSVYAGYGSIVLGWKPVSGALGYRLARASWDAARSAWIQGSEVEIPAEPISASSRIFKQVWENDGGTDGDTGALAYPWTLEAESTYVSSAVGLKSDTVVGRIRNDKSWLRKVITVVSPAGLIADTTYTDYAVTPGVQYVYWLDTHFRSASGAFYSPNTTPYPTVTAVPRDPALMTWLPPEAERLTAPVLVRAVPDAKGVLVEWQPKRAAVGYLVMRTLRGDRTYPQPENLTPGGSCYPYIAWAYVQTTSSITVDLFDHKTSPRFCIGIFAIYANAVVDGTPTAILSWNPDAFLKHLDMLVRKIHSDGLFLWAEWDDAAGKWRLLPQGSFTVDVCMRERNMLTRQQLHCLDSYYY